MAHEIPDLILSEPPWHGVEFPTPHQPREEHAMSVFNTEPTRDDDDRSVALRWELGPTLNFHGEPATAIAELQVVHDVNSKQFLASVMRIDLSPSGGQMFTIGKGTNVRLLKLPCARFSRKGLDAAVATSLAHLRSNLELPEIISVGKADSPA